MTAMCECYDVSGTCGSRSSSDAVEPPKPGELFGEAALTLAVPLGLAIAVSLLLPMAGFALQ
jgi:hypothetical protein